MLAMVEIAALVMRLSMLPDEQRSNAVKFLTYVLIGVHFTYRSNFQLFRQLDQLQNA